MRSKEHKSTTIEGASFSLYEVTRGLRHSTDEKMAKLKQQYRILLNQYTKAIYDEKGQKKLQYVLSADELAQYKKNNDGADPSPELLTEDEQNRIATVDVQMDILNGAMRMEIVRARLAGFKIPGEEFGNLKTADELFNEAPELFALEIEAKANEDWSLAEAVRKNSESPTSSQPPGDGQTTITTATPVNSSTTTTTDTAS